MTDTRIEVFEVTQPHLTVAGLVFQAYGREASGIAARVLALNPGLAAKLPYIPIGEKVSVPFDISPQAARRRVAVFT